jgi:hypothetical protein
MHTHASNAGIKLDQTRSFEKKLDQTQKGGHIDVGACTFMITSHCCPRFAAGDVFSIAIYRNV